MIRTLLLCSACALGQSWQMQESGTAVSLRGISAVSGRVAWASGAKGTVLRTLDGGSTWMNVSPPGVADLDFRDIEAIDERTAFAMAAGEGRASRLYKTTDGGAAWTLLRANGPQGFWDAIAMWDATHGILLGDPVDGRFTILTTSDGVTWAALEGPKAEKGEAAFAASGTALVARGTREAWFGTGGPGGGRVFHTEDSGRTWSVVRTPLRPESEGAGIFSLGFAGATGIAAGGDYTKATETKGNIAVLEGGRWSVPAGAPGGYRSGVGLFEGKWIAVGTSGCDISADGGRTWRMFSQTGFHAFSGGWAVGPEGRIGKLLF